MNRAYILVLGVLWLSSCDFVKMKDTLAFEETEEEQPIARVNDIYLYPSDMEGVVPSGVAPADSADRAEMYINSWVGKQLLISEATSRIDFDEAEIQRKILDYRYSLIAYQYKSYYINQNLNKTVSEEEVVKYYEENQDNFPVKQNLVRGKFIRVSKEAPKLQGIRKLLYSSKEEDQDALRDFCLSYASAYSVEDSTWLVFDEIIQNTPLAEIPNKVDFLSRRKYVESSDDTHVFFLKIDEYKKTDETSPLEVVRDRIEDIIINKRKVELASNLEKEVYEKASNNNAVEVFK